MPMWPTHHLAPPSLGLGTWMPVQVLSRPSCSQALEAWSSTHRSQNHWNRGVQDLYKYFRSQQFESILLTMLCMTCAAWFKWWINGTNLNCDVSILNQMPCNSIGPRNRKEHKSPRLNKRNPSWRETLSFELENATLSVGLVFQLWGSTTKISWKHILVPRLALGTLGQSEAWYPPDLKNWQNA